MTPEMSQVAICDLVKRIHLVRGRKVMLDADLARLYEVETKALNRAVKRNLDRFPKDFMFRLTADEAESLRCQFGTSKKVRGGRRYLPLAFSEQGVAMLSGVLTSRRAVQVNVAIMRAFVRLREMIAAHGELAERLGKLERDSVKHGRNIRTLFEAIDEFMNPPDSPRPRVGFKPSSK